MWCLVVCGCLCVVLPWCHGAFLGAGRVVECRVVLKFVFVVFFVSHHFVNELEVGLQLWEMWVRVRMNVAKK